MIQRAIYPPLVEHPRLRQILTEGEKKVLDVFNDHLPSDWEIYIQPHLNGLRPDFVLMNPNGGIGVFEVKDWDLRAMRYFTKKDQWGHTLWAERDGKEFCIQKENPITKVNLYKKEIFDLYCPRLQKGNGWAAITAGAIFPFARADDVKKLFEPFLKSTSGDRYARYQPVSGIEELSSGDLEAIFPEFSRTGSRVMSEDRAQDLRGWLVEPDFASTQRKPLVLDRNQRTLAETRTDTGYRRIKGPAGSGKSLVLAARAARLANEGKSVLVATFNITLWHYLRDLIVRDIEAPHRIRNIQFTHFHLWCKHVCHEVGWEHRYDDLWKSVFSDGRKEDVLNVALPRLAEEAINQPESPFCALSVTMDLDNCGINHGVFQVGIIRQRIEYAPENIGFPPIAEPPEHRVPVAEPFRQVAPRTARAHNPQHRFQKQSVVFSAPSRVA